MIIPAILTRRLTDELPEAFTARQDACRNEANRLGLHAPEKFGSNLFDEDTVEAGVFGQLPRWQVLIVYDFGDLADTRDELAERLDLLDAAGVSVISVADQIDLRGLDEANQAALKAFRAWRGLPATEVALELPVKIGTHDAPKQTTQTTQSTAEEKEETKAAPDWTPEQESHVRAHLALHGKSKPAELGKLCGKHWKTAESWLAYAESNPSVTPGPDNTDGE